MTLCLAGAVALSMDKKKDAPLFGNSRFAEVVASATPAAGDASGLPALPPPTEAEVKAMEAKCAVHKLCTPCTHDPDCVWCADGQGTCMPGNEKGPVATSTCKNYEVDYCLNEPCGAYSNCHTCTTDPFCGFCHGSSSSEKICVEGEKNGPLTGFCPTDKWDHAHKGGVKCAASTLYEEKLVAGATGIAGTDEAEAAAAIADMEGVAAKLGHNANNAKATEMKLINGEAKAFGLVGHLKALIRSWKERKNKIRNAENLDRGFFEAKFNQLYQARKERLVKLQTIEQEMHKEAEQDQKLMLRRTGQKAKLEAASEDDDAALAKGEDADNEDFAHMDWGGGLGAHMEQSNANFQELQKYLTHMSSKHKNLLKNLGRKARKALEREMRAASARKMAKQEAVWYACAYLLSNKDAKCYEFHDRYSGTEKARELTAEENTRVCNQVRAAIEEKGQMPKYDLSGTGLSDFKNEAMQKDLHLGWCINNIHVDPKFDA